MRYLCSINTDLHAQHHFTELEWPITAVIKWTTPCDLFHTEQHAPGYLGIHFYVKHSHI